MIPLDYGATLVTRDEWGARDPRSVTPLWVNMVTSHWEGPHMGVFPHDDCAGKIRGIQNFHMDSRGWSDIAYNAVACPHGYVFEARGQGVRSAANGTTTGNSSAYAVCYLGGEGDEFTEPGKSAMKAAGDWLTHALSPRNAHRDWKATACPGDEIYQWTHDGQPVIWQPPIREDWFDMATAAELADEIRKQGPWLGQVLGDPSNALFVFHAGTRTWVSTMEAVVVQLDYFRNLHSDGGKPFTPTVAEAKGFHLVNRAELEAHLGAPYEY